MYRDVRVYDMGEHGEASSGDRYFNFRCTLCLRPSLYLLSEHTMLK